jgi:hypothetical protein
MMKRRRKSPRKEVIMNNLLPKSNMVKKIPLQIL